MLRIPLIRQPDDVACLPTCIRVVLAYRGIPLSAEDAAQTCDTDHEGTVVVCDVGENAVTVMDPAQGELVTIAIARFESLWCRVQNEGLVVGTRQQPS